MPKRPETSQTLSRGLDVLRLLAGPEAPLSTARIAAELGLSRAIVYRLVSTLAEHGLVRRNPDGSLAIGLGALQLTQNLHAGLRDTANEYLDRLANEAGATAHLVVADGDDALALAVVEPRGTTFHVAHRVGSRTPLGVGAAGKALVAAREGRGGLFFSEGELTPGAYGISAPLPRVRGIAAAVGIVTLAGNATPVMRELVERTALELDDALGSPVIPAPDEPDTAG
ncbi:IclR family transcriptional regulator [Actinomadura nitritigenes]|uniref:IclR family transcriptional regulator n=1 Tax=Actinomadura nitritigenes TaxID=134602 RepID=UPI003D9191CC